MMGHFQNNNVRLIHNSSITQKRVKCSDSVFLFLHLFCDLTCSDGGRRVQVGPFCPGFGLQVYLRDRVSADQHDSMMSAVSSFFLFYAFCWFMNDTLNVCNGSQWPLVSSFTSLAECRNVTGNQCKSMAPTPGRKERIQLFKIKCILFLSFLGI